MNSINIKKWKNFLLTELFDITGSTTTPKQKLNLSDNAQFPYVTTAGTNNGICGYSNVYTEIGNVLTVDSAVLGTVFYQKDNFTASDHVEKLIPKFNLTENIANFIVTVLNNSAKTLGYAYNEKRSQQALKSEQIKLPVNVNGEPDWEYMESYMKNIMQDSEKNLENLQNISEHKNKIDVKNWQEFLLGGKNGLFEVTRPNARSAQTYNEGNMPYIASGCFNNGVCGYFEPKDKEDFDKGNCITVSPVDGYAFYQKNDFLGRGGAGSSIIMLRRKNLNEYIGKFICTVIRNTCKDWSYSNMGNKDKLKDTIIKLPTTSNGEPDWEYMENYMKNIMQNSKMNIEKMVKLMDGNI